MEKVRLLRGLWTPECRNGGPGNGVPMHSL